MHQGTVRGWEVRGVGRAAVESLSCRSVFLQYELFVFRALARGSYTGRLSCSSLDSCQVLFQPSLEQSKGQCASRLLVTTKPTRSDPHCIFGKIEGTYSDEMEHDPQSGAGLLSGHSCWRGLDSSIRANRQEA
jgi:hypothetical protein